MNMQATMFTHPNVIVFNQSHPAEEMIPEFRAGNRAILRSAASKGKALQILDHSGNLDALGLDGISTQFDLVEGHGGIMFRSVAFPDKYLRITDHGITDGNGDAGIWCAFRAHRSHLDPNHILIESLRFPGWRLGSDEHGKVINAHQAGEGYHTMFSIQVIPLNGHHRRHHHPHHNPPQHNQPPRLIHQPTPHPEVIYVQQPPVVVFPPAQIPAPVPHQCAYKLPLRFHLRTAHGTYVSCDKQGFVKQTKNCGHDEIWTFAEIPGRDPLYFCGLRSYNGKSLSGEGSGQNYAVVVKDKIRGWETWRYHYINEKVTFQSNEFNTFLCANAGGTFVNDRTEAKDWEHYEVIPLPVAPEIPIELMNPNRYLSSNENELCSEKAPKIPYTVFYEETHGLHIMLRTYSGLYVAIDHNGNPSLVGQFGSEPTLFFKEPTANEHHFYYKNHYGYYLTIGRFGKVKSDKLKSDTTKFHVTHR